MKEYTIDGKKILFDATKQYLDFYRENGKPRLPTIAFERMLQDLETGKLPADEKIQAWLQELQRWKTDAPRKRSLRKIADLGVIVATSDELFQGEGGDKIIDSLENTGVFADYLLSTIYKGR